MIRIKRVYEPASQDDGYRILVDRLWPRGVSKEKAAIDWWDKDITPSSQLRKWFSHDSSKFEEFSLRYIQELDANEVAVNELLRVIRDHDMVTLVYAAKDPQCNHVIVLRKYLEQAGQANGSRSF